MQALKARVQSTPVTWGGLFPALGGFSARESPMTRSVTRLAGPRGTDGLTSFPDARLLFIISDRHRTVKSLNATVENSFYCIEAYISKRTQHPS